MNHGLGTLNLAPGRLRSGHLIPLNNDNDMTTTLPSPPFIDIPGVANFRDAGDGQTFHQGLLYRSADPTNAKPEGLDKMSRGLGTCQQQPPQ